MQMLNWSLTFPPSSSLHSRIGKDAISLLERFKIRNRISDCYYPYYGGVAFPVEPFQQCADKLLIGFIQREPQCWDLLYDASQLFLYFLWQELEVSCSRLETDTRSIFFSLSQRLLFTHKKISTRRNRLLPQLFEVIQERVWKELFTQHSRDSLYPH